MKKSLLIALLLLPLAWAKVSPESNILPIPDCFPCDDVVIWPVQTAQNILPIPDCFPCDDVVIWPATLKANILPIPDCFPCDDVVIWPAQVTRKNALIPVSFSGNGIAPSVASQKVAMNSRRELAIRRES